jgi:hypothetical protein
LAEQLSTIAEDFVADYDRFSIVGLIQSTISVLQQRAPQGANYSQNAASIRQKCNEILASSRCNTYPFEWQRIGNSSDFKKFLAA